MRYFGGKARVATPLSQFLNSQLKEGQPFVDLFCGSCNVITKIDNDRVRIANDKHKYLIAMWKELQSGWIPPTNLTQEEYQYSCNVITKIDNDRVRIANDKHKYLIAMWKELQSGWIPPTNLTQEEYQYIKENKEDKPYLTGFVGFGCSFAGKWFGGYARTSVDRNENFCLSSHRSCLSKIDKMLNVSFNNGDYLSVDIPVGSLVYCDIPYKNATPYCKNEVGIFNHDEFYQWVRDNSDKYDIYISEYLKNVPDDFEIVWTYQSNKEIRDIFNHDEFYQWVRDNSDKYDIYISEYLKNVPDDFEIVWTYQSNKEIRDKDGIRQPTTEVLMKYKSR